jgi:hypothetical protein
MSHTKILFSFDYKYGMGTTETKLLVRHRKRACNQARQMNHSKAIFLILSNSQFLFILFFHSFRHMILQTRWFVSRAHHYFLLLLPDEDLAYSKGLTDVRFEYSRQVWNIVRFEYSRQVRNIVGFEYSRQVRNIAEAKYDVASHSLSLNTFHFNKTKLS